MKSDHQVIVVLSAFSYSDNALSGSLFGMREVMDEARTGLKDLKDNAGVKDAFQAFNTISAIGIADRFTGGGASAMVMDGVEQGGARLDAGFLVARPGVERGVSTRVQGLFCLGDAIADAGRFETGRDNLGRGSAAVAKRVGSEWSCRVEAGGGSVHAGGSDLEPAGGRSRDSQHGGAPVLRTVGMDAAAFASCGG